MTEQRQRNDIYYLERISGPVLMHKDGSVGRLDKKEVDVIVRVPGRIEGREYIRHETISRLGEVALFTDLPGCLADQKQVVFDRPPFGFKDTDWALEDMPDATLEEYQNWCERPSINLESLRSIATEQAVAWEHRQEKLSLCKDCENSKPNYQYACRTCGYSRELYVYPIVRYRDDEVAYDVPMDAAAIVQLQPDSLSLKVRPYFNKSGMMIAERVLQFDARELPNGYIPYVSSESRLRIDPAEDLVRPLEIVIERWIEADERHRMSENARARFHGPDEYATARGFLESTESCMQAIQTQIMQRLYHERRDSEQSGARLDELRRKVGGYALELAYEYSAAGMGESDAKFMLARRHGEYVDVQSITYEIDVQHGVEKALTLVDQKNH
jgi:hypothetical protein